MCVCVFPCLPLKRCEYVLHRVVMYFFLNWKFEQKNWVSQSILLLVFDAHQSIPLPCPTICEHGWILVLILCKFSVDKFKSIRYRFTLPAVFLSFSEIWFLFCWHASSTSDFADFKWRWHNGKISEKHDNDLFNFFLSVAPTHVSITGATEARVGDIVPLQCTTAPSNPPAEIKWMVSGRQIRNATSKTVVSPEGTYTNTHRARRATRTSNEIHILCNNNKSHDSWNTNCLTMHNRTCLCVLIKLNISFLFKHLFAGNFRVVIPHSGACLIVILVYDIRQTRWQLCTLLNSSECIYHHSIENQLPIQQQQCEQKMKNWFQRHISIFWAHFLFSILLANHHWI